MKKQWVRGWVHRHGGKLSVIVGAVLAAGLGLTVAHWGWLADGQAGSTAVRNMALVFGGVVALWIAGWRAVVADQQADAAREQAGAADRQAETAEADLRNKRYQESAAMLGNERLAVRMAGIYALQRLAEDHPREHHVQAMKLLCSYVRRRTSDGAIEDVQAAIEAISTCHGRQLALEREAEYRLDLRGTNLTGAILPDLDLSAAIFGTSHFDPRDDGPSSILKGADLQGAILTNAHLYGVDLTDANLQGANLTGAQLMGANLSGAVFSSQIWIEGTRDLKAVGLTQKQLDWALCEPGNPPLLHGLFEPNTEPPVRLEPPQLDPNGEPHADRSGGPP